MTLLTYNPVQRRLSEADKLRARCAQMVGSVNRFHAASPILNELIQNLPALDVISRLLVEVPPDDPFAVHAERFVEGQRDRLSMLREVLAEQSYPFEHADGSVSLVQYAFADVSWRGDADETLAGVQQVLDRMGALSARLIGELAVIAEQVEAAVGLAPLPTFVKEQSAIPNHE